MINKIGAIIFLSLVIITSSAAASSPEHIRPIILEQFEIDLIKNQNDIFLIYQRYLITHSEYAVDITRAFLRGNEEYVTAIGASAMIALEGLAISDEQLAENARAISAILSKANPSEAVAIMSTMMAAMPTLGKQIIDGVMIGAPEMSFQVAAISYEFSLNNTLAEDEPIVETPQPDTSSTLDSLSESQIVGCLSEPCI